MAGSVGCPAQRISPESGGCQPASRVRIVDLPEPDRPRRIPISPRRSPKLASRTAWTLSLPCVKVREIPRASTASSAPAGAAGAPAPCSLDGHAAFDHPAALEMQDARSDGGHVRVVGRDDERPAAAGVPADRLEQELRRVAIELRGGLVGDDERCLTRQGERECGTRLLASGELDRLRAHPVGEPDVGEQALPEAGQVACVLGERQVRDEVVGGLLADVGDALATVAAELPRRGGPEVTAVDEELSARGPVEPGECAKERRLAASGRADDRRDLAERESGIDGAQSLDPAARGVVGLRERVAGDEGIRRHATPRSCSCAARAGSSAPPPRSRRRRGRSRSPRSRRPGSRATAEEHPSAADRCGG